MFIKRFTNKPVGFCGKGVKSMFILILFISLITSCDLLDSDEDSEDSKCYKDLPTPILVLTGTEDYIGSDSNEYTRYKLSVSNSSAYPDELFAASPHLPACGLNTNSSRTWVDIFDNNDNRIYGFCALSSSADLNSIWFAVPKGDTPPDSIYIVLNDRECDREYKSNEVTINEDPECYEDLPTPILVLTGTEDYIGSDSNEYTRYKLSVSNSSAYPDELFAASPHLPACGLNTNSSRTWVDIFDNNDNRIYGFCALSSSADLNSIWFAVPKGDTPPDSIYIVLNDRECDREYKSNNISTDYSSEDFIANWVNENSHTDGITRVEIGLDTPNLIIHMWGACVPTECDWGTESTPVTDAFDGILEIIWDQGFAVRTQTLEIVEPNRMRVTSHTHFTDDSGRADYTAVYYFVK